MSFPRWSLLVALAALVLPLSGRAQVKASLVAESTAIQPGAPLVVALHLEHDAGWHTYWLNPGIGLPTEMKWDLPEGWTASEIQWPAPEVILDSSETIIGTGYHGDVLLPIVLTPPDDLAPGTSIELKGVADWLMCADVCIPGSASLSLTLPVSRDAPSSDSQWTPRLQELMDARPRADSAWTVSAQRSDRNVLLTVTPTDASGPIASRELRTRDLRFFTNDDLVDFAAGQRVQSDGAGGFILRLPVTTDFTAEGTRLAGVLVSSSGSWVTNASLPALQVDISFTSIIAGAAPFDADPVAGGIVGTIFLAAIGGLILNLMPCVFPVLGIKILGFVNQAGSSRRAVAAHGLAFTGGILISFWILAAVLAVFRAGGAQLGWGFQLQSPAFVFGLAAVMLIFALSLSGVFEFGLRASAIGGSLQRQPGLAGTFFSGVLATVVATPCSAPFLAPALGAALALPTGQSVVVFTAIGVGLATPYLVLSLFPQAVKFLPRPGAWMESFRQFMAFPLYATVVYLLWVLAGQVSESGLLTSGFGLVLIAMAAWCYGRWAQAPSPSPRRRIGLAAGIVLFAIGATTGLPRPPAENAVEWQPWSREAVAALRAEGRTIFVDFTARWCATCQANKKLVFGSDEVRQVFADRNIATLRADWTNRDPAITAELAAYNRSAVPFDLIWLPGQEEPVILPELLTPGVVLEAIEP